MWKDWNWTEKYPGWEELRKYFAHVENKWDIKKDVAFDTRVVGAQFNNKTHRWDIKTEDGRTAHSRYLINALGFAAKRHFPDWKGLDTFKGEMYHSSFWPEEGVDLRNKRVAVVGTGSTGVQIAQEAGTHGAHCTVFQRKCQLMGVEPEGTLANHATSIQVLRIWHFRCASASSRERNKRKQRRGTRICTSTE